jgi:hypothetical protein
MITDEKKWWAMKYGPYGALEETKIEKPVKPEPVLDENPEHFMSLAGSQNFYDIANWRSGYMTSRFKHMQPGERAAWTILYGEHGSKAPPKEDVIENEQRAIQATKISGKLKSKWLPIIEASKHKTDNIENPQVDKEFFKTSIDWLKLHKPKHEKYIEDVTDPPVAIPDIPEWTVRGLLLKAVMNQTSVFKYFIQLWKKN